MSFSSPASAAGHEGVWKPQARGARVFGHFCALLDEAAALQGRSTTSTHREPIALCVHEAGHEHGLGGRHRTLDDRVRVTRMTLCRHRRRDAAGEFRTGFPRALDKAIWDVAARESDNEPATRLGDVYQKDD